MKLKQLLVALTTLLPSVAIAQKIDTIKVGTLVGRVKDSLHNYVMPSATLAIYRAIDNELVNYQLSNSYGNFQFKQVPVGVPLTIVITHVGYMPTKAEFIVSPKVKTFDLKTLNMRRIDQSLEEVIISASQAPMQMHGDTLEFNASAFKLDTNAVVEDLLRKLPGVTVWGDGVITVNGKQISKLLVEGKEFFGNDNKIALQNLPKNSVQKIQVYQDKEDKDPITPKTNMNIVLKKDKKSGFFGKFGLGGGTQGHYAGDAMISYFSPKTQIAVVGALNDINKYAYSVNTLMGFNSFKGEGINNDYHSDFTVQGKNAFKGTGFTASHDFSKDADARQPYYKTNLLRGEFFLNDLNNNTTRESFSDVSLGGADGHVMQANSSANISNNYSHRASLYYNKRILHSSINASINLTTNRNSSVNTQNSSSVNNATSDRSQSFAQQNSTSSSTDGSGELSVTTERYYDVGKRKSRSLDLELAYKFNFNDGSRDSKNITDFKATDATQNKYFNRQYLTSIRGSEQILTTTLKNLVGLLQRRKPRISVDVKNMIEIHNDKENSDVSDLATGSATYIPNSNLTNVTHYKTVDERPGFLFSKSFFKGLDNRFQKNWYLQVFSEGQIYLQRNSAFQTFQNLNRSYFYFIPSAAVRFLNTQYGNYNKSYSLSINTYVDYPQVWQIAPLNDDANIYNTQVGNPSLRPSYREEFNFSYDFTDLATRNSFSYTMNFSGGIVKHSFSDSTSYDEFGRYVRATINLGDRKYLNASGSIRKVFKIKNHQFQFTSNPSLSYNRYLVSAQSQYYETRQEGANMSAEVNYSYGSIWSAAIGEYFSGNKVDQDILSHSTYYNWTTNLGFAFAFPRGIFFNTRLNFNNSKSSSAAANVYYTIWNADVGYRFLKSAEAEVKLSALDILHQNRSIYNSVYNNTTTTNIANVLQQYFMLTLAYYPRKFGLKN